MEHVELRPVERRILRLAGEGVSVTEIARRFHRSSDHIERVIGWAALPGREGATEIATLRPLERRVLHWRDQGAAYEDIGPRFRRSADFVARASKVSPATSCSLRNGRAPCVFSTTSTARRPRPSSPITWRFPSRVHTTVRSSG